jgi:hypothetical protein
MLWQWCVCLSSGFQLLTSAVIHSETDLCRCSAGVTRSLSATTKLDCIPQAAGYRVIEVNPSVNRAGAQVQRLVGEATQSQRVALTTLTAAATEAGAAAGGTTDDNAAAAGVPQGRPAKETPVSSFFRPQKAAAHAGKQSGGTSSQLGKGGGSASGGKKGSASSPLQSPAAGTCAAPANGQAQAQSCAQSPPLTLLLFEEVENLQDEDRGFISTLQELLACSKVHFLTASSRTRSLPNGLRFLKIMPYAHTALAAVRQC